MLVLGRSLGAGRRLAAEPPALAKARPSTTPAITTARSSRRRRASEPPWADAAALVIARATRDDTGRTATRRPGRGPRGVRRRQWRRSDPARSGRSAHRSRPDAVSRRAASAPAAELFETALTARRCSAARPAGAARLVGDGARSRSADAPGRSAPRRCSSGSASAWKRSCGRILAAPWRTTGWRWRRAARATSIAPGTRRLPPGSERPSHPRRPASSAPTSIASSCRPSFPSAPGHGRPGIPGGDRGAPCRMGARQAAVEIAADRSACPTWEPLGGDLFKSHLPGVVIGTLALCPE